ncbi:hypothetical protein DIPPA_31489 [Diplonema papillatum]|nr:hypothetical protein DIPPA_31489 [Diplonema papillatum]
MNGDGRGLNDSAPQGAVRKVVKLYAECDTPKRGALITRRRMGSTRRVDMTAEGDGIQRINMLKIARRARLSVDALLKALEDSGDRREVRFRTATDPATMNYDIVEASSSGRSPEVDTERDTEGESGNEHEALLSGGGSANSPTASRTKTYMDVSFTEEVPAVDDLATIDTNSPAQSNGNGTVQHLVESACHYTGFGLLLSPSMAHTQRVSTSSGGSTPTNMEKRDAFMDWLANAPTKVDRDNRVSVSVEMPPERVDWEYEAVLLLDPTAAKTGALQWVFAVPYTASLTASESLEARLYSHLPSEILSVTLYCDACTYPSSSLASIVISVELSRPAWAWLVLAVGTISASVVQPLVTHLNIFASRPSLAALWWSQADVVSFSLLFLFTCSIHHWRPTETGLLKEWTGGILLIFILSAGWAGLAIFWAMATNNVESDHDGCVGPTIQGIVLHGLHPIYIALMRTFSRQPVFMGELLGLLLVAAGMSLVAGPFHEHSWREWGASDGYAAASAFFTAIFLVCANHLAAQLPAAVVLFPSSVLSCLFLLGIAFADDAIHDTFGSEGVFGWAQSASSVKWWIALLCVHAAQQLCFMHALRYLHPLAVSVALAMSALISTFWSEYLFDGVHIIGGFGSVVTIPGMILAIIGGLLAMYAAAERRQHVEIEITNEKFMKRQRTKSRLTPVTLQKSQEQYDGSLYATASKGQEQP